MLLVVVDGEPEQTRRRRAGRTSRASRSAPSRPRRAPGPWRPSWPAASANTVRTSSSDASSKPGRETRLGPRPVRIVLLGEPGQARPPDLVLDRDEVTDRLVRPPLAVRDRPPLGHAGLGGRGEPAGERGERVDELGPVHAGLGLLVDEVRGEPAFRLVERGRPFGRRSRPAGRDRSGRPRSSGCPGSTGSSRTPPRPATSRRIRSAGCRPATPPRAGRRACAFSVWSGQAG